MGIKSIDLELCNGCGICVERCPMDVLRMDEEPKKAFIKYLRDCQTCLKCENDCPTGAVYVFPVFENRMPRSWYIGG